MYHVNYKFKLLLCGIVVIGFSLLISSSSVASSEQVLIIGTTDFVTNLSPTNSYDYWTWHVLRQTSEGLVTIEPGTSKITPALAKSWEIDEKKYTFHLREGVTFWDGAPFNCQAMKWSLERNLQLDGPENAVFLIKMIENISCIDSLTLRIKIDSPNATFLARLADIAPSLALSPSTTPDDEFAKGHYAGTGPYKLVEYIPEEKVVYEAFQNYWGPQPKIKKVIERFYPNPTALRSAVEKGEADVGFRTFLPEDILDVQNNSDLKVMKGKSLSIRYLVFTVTQSPFTDRRIRQAIAYVINRNAICDKVFYGLNDPLYSMVPAGLWSHIDAFPKRDLNKAKELLAEAGYSNWTPLKITLWYTPKHYGSTEAEVAEVIKESLKETGIIEVNTRALDWGAYINRMSQGELGFFLLGWYPDFIDPDNFLSPWLIDSPQGLGTHLNVASRSYDRETHDRFLKLLKDARKVTEIKERAVLYEKAQKLLADSAILIPLWQNNLQQVAIAQKNVQGIVLDASMWFRNWLISKSAPPISDFSATPTSGTALLTVDFTNLSTGDINSYRWKLGDGNYSTAKDPSHTYTNPGNYTVSLTVSGPGGSDTETKTNFVSVTSPNKPPTVSFTYSPLNPTDLDVIKFQDLSTDPDGKIDSWHWDFGDGNSSRDQNPTHRYQDDGTYSVNLTVIDDDSARNNLTRNLKVYNVEPKAEFTIAPNKPAVNASVTFDASDSSDPDGTIKEYQWDFDDGSTGKGEKVTHTYTSEGTYQVKLTIIDDDGDTDSIQNEIQVGVAPPEVKDRYGIVIGISDYKYADEATCNGPKQFCDLKYSSVDAQVFYELLIEEETGAFPSENVTLLVGEEATGSNIKSAFGRLIALAEEDDLVVIYYSGHGGQGPDFGGDEEDGTDEYYLPYNTEVDDLFGTAIRDDEFGDWMEQLKSKKVIIFLDSCYSGGATKAVKGITQSGYKAASNNSVFNDFSLEDKTLLSASQENEYSYEYPELSHGVFTYYLLQGLRGEADLDNDNRIVVDELYEYIKDEVKRYVADHGGKQTPLMKGARANLTLATPRARQAGKVTVILGGKEEAAEGDKVMISLGKNQGVKVGNVFEVYHEYQAKAVKIEEVRGRIKVIELVGQERALCEVVELIVPIEIGDVVQE